MLSSGHDVTAVVTHTRPAQDGVPHPLSLLMVTEGREPWFFSRIAICRLLVLQ